MQRESGFKMRIVFFLALALASNSQSLAATVTVRFTGQVVSVFGNPFGAGIKRSDPVAGQFVYADASSPSDPDITCDCMGYRQHAEAGFRATIGKAALMSGDYVVSIKNDLPQVGGPLDTLSVTFSNKFSPALPSPLTVNGGSYPHSLLQVNFNGPATAFSAAVLPSPLDLTGFTAAFNLLDDVTSDIFVGVLFRIDQATVETAPEPSSILVMSSAGIWLITIAHRKKARRGTNC